MKSEGLSLFSGVPAFGATGMKSFSFLRTKITQHKYIRVQYADTLTLFL